MRSTDRHAATIKDLSTRRVGVCMGIGIAFAASLLALNQASARGQDAALVYPVDIVADGDRVIVADFKAHGLFAVDADGKVTVIAQGPGLPKTPLYGARAVVAAPDGDGWLVADPGTFSLYRVSRDGTLSTITSELDIPQGLARFDDSSVLVADLRSGIGAVMRVTLDGERITDTEMIVGYLHRSMEKQPEERPWTHNIPFTDRMDYLAALTVNLSYFLAVPPPTAVPAPPRPPSPPLLFP